MKITLFQYVLATNWLPVCWQWAWAIGAVCTTTWMTKPSLTLWTTPNFVLLFAAIVPLSFLSGWFASIIPALFVFGPLAYYQGIDNGGPFVPGDKVQIIAGKHRGKIARVYGTGQHDTVRVDLGETERTQYTDFFSAYELIRETADKQLANPEF